MASRIESRAFEKRFLSRIRPSYSHGPRIPYYPASCRTTDGRSLTHVIFVRESRIEEIYNLERLKSTLLSPGLVAEVYPSLERIPKRIVNQVNDMMETGHGVLCFILAMKDGRKVSYFGGGTVGGDIDFLQLPTGFVPAEVKSVQFMRPPPPADLPCATALESGDMTFCLY